MLAKATRIHLKKAQRSRKWLRRLITQFAPLLGTAFAPVPPVITRKGPAMKNLPSSATKGFFIALKGLATIAEIAIIAGIAYAAATAARYWPDIGV